MPPLIEPGSVNLVPIVGVSANGQKLVVADGLTQLKASSNTTGAVLVLGYNEHLLLRLCKQHVNQPSGPALYIWSQPQRLNPSDDKQQAILYLDTSNADLRSSVLRRLLGCAMLLAGSVFYCGKGSLASRNVENDLSMLASAVEAVMGQAGLQSAATPLLPRVVLLLSDWPQGHLTDALNLPSTAVLAKQLSLLPADIQQSLKLYVDLDLVLIPPSDAGAPANSTKGAPPRRMSFHRENNNRPGQQQGQQSAPQVEQGPASDTSLVLLPSTASITASLSQRAISGSLDLEPQPSTAASLLPPADSLTTSGPSVSPPSTKPARIARGPSCQQLVRLNPFAAAPTPLTTAVDTAIHSACSCASLRSGSSAMMSGPAMSSLCRAYVDRSNAGASCTFSSCYNTMMSSRARDAVDEAIVGYLQNMTQGGLPPEPRHREELHNEMRALACQDYLNRVATVGDSASIMTNFRELKRRCEESFQTLIQTAVTEGSNSGNKSFAGGKGRTVRGRSARSRLMSESGDRGQPESGGPIALPPLVQRQAKTESGVQPLIDRTHLSGGTLRVIHKQFGCLQPITLNLPQLISDRHIIHSMCRSSAPSVLGSLSPLLLAEQSVGGNSEPGDASSDRSRSASSGRDVSTPRDSDLGAIKSSKLSNLLKSWESKGGKVLPAMSLH